MKKAKENATYNRLLDTTEQIVKEKGCQQTTLTDIMKRSGLSKGGIYHYVESKNELLSLVLNRRLEHRNQKYAQQLNQMEKPPDFLPFIMQHVEHLDQKTDVSYEILHYLLSHHDDLAARQMIRQYYKQSVRITERWIERGKAIGLFWEQMDTKKMADLFVLIVSGMQYRQVIPGEMGHFSTSDLTRLMGGMLGKK